MRFEVVKGIWSLPATPAWSWWGAALSHTRLRERVNGVNLPQCPEPKSSNGEVITTMVGLISLGKPDFEAVEPFRNDPFFLENPGHSGAISREIETELGLERMLSGKFATNGLVFLLGMLVYNILWVIAQLGLEVQMGAGGRWWSGGGCGA